ncbi:hypothetical protein ACFQ05_31675 [Amycolatopsis umgeniensis]|uniref:Guanylate cyclase domain-containing protein n=1 Tax=Amycolatopsis umgeniensis TaxID=336628 RepID=A0A841BEP5_9PSEU|nr:hypothetical protein [Amycolatopsis umgeniensis]MBB5857470.1 hypothetical protein [Amycolatopsis umgeniensis]
MRTRSAVHRTVLAVDVQGFGDQRRTTPHQLVVRDGMYRAVENAFGAAGMSWAECHREDRGDGLVVLAPAQAPKSSFVELFPHAVAAELRAHNATRRAEQQIRLRLALHAGEVVFDDHGVTGAAVNLTFRLLDAPVLKEALAESPGVLAMVTSGWFFEEVVRNSPVADQTAFRRVRVAVKETATVAWISRPDHPYPASPEAPSPKQEEPGQTGATVTMTATSSDSGRVYQAARDQQITEA